MADIRLQFGAAHGAAVQPRGALLVFDPETLETLETSNNLGALLGVSPEDALGFSVESIVGTQAANSFRRILKADGTAANPIPVRLNGLNFDAIVHRSGPYGIVEFEPWLESSRPLNSASVYGAFHRLASAKSSQSLMVEAAREFRTITGFDRVMIYQFQPDGHGRVVADEHYPDMESYLGLQYPSSDIPEQTRSLYRTLFSRTIVDSGGEAHDLVARPGHISRADLSHCELRTASPHHVDFMRTMGQASTLSFSLIYNTQLVGVITCVHRTPRWAPFSLRQGLEILANQVALHITSMNTIEKLSGLVSVRTTRASLLAQAQASDDIAHSLVAGRLTVLDLIPADGAVISLGGVTTAVGVVPAFSDLELFVAHCRASGPTTARVSDSLANDDSPLAAILPDVAGLILVPLGGGGLTEGNYLAWFRRERVQAVQWLGAQSASTRIAPALSEPSSNSWREEIFGSSEPWAGVEVEAIELGRDLDRAMLVRIESKLADLSLRDGLTGLPNRRLLMDRLDHALTKYARGEELALLFIDLDGVTKANESLGQDAGDALLTHTAIKIEASIRAQDTVARFGGHEFVVMCENTTSEEAMIVANRILAAIGSSIPGIGETPSASIGLASARFNFSAFDLLNEASAALTRAKTRGKNAVSQ